jgi:putative spermidine/putrescine transport system substrate-binding protein
MKILRTITSAALLALLPASAMAQTVLDSPELYEGERALYDAALAEGMVVSFDTGPTWANWAAQFRAFQNRYPDIQLVYNDLGSAATVVALDKARNRPQADTAYYFAGSAVDASAKGVVAPFKPVNFDRLSDVFRHPDGEWFTIHSLTIAFIVNTNLVPDVPQSWADLLKPEYRNQIVYLDPRSTGVGQVLTFAANFGNGGDMENVEPGIEYLGTLHQAGNVLRVVGTTPYAQFVKGEIPIWISYENDGLRAKYTDGLGDAVAVVIPEEASAAAPYAISLVNNGPNPNAGKLWLNFIMTDYGQGIFAEGFVRPAVPGIELPESVADKLPAAPQVRPLDVQLAAAKKAEIDAGWARVAVGQ